MSKVFSAHRHKERGDYAEKVKNSVEKDEVAKWWPRLFHSQGLAGSWRRCFSSRNLIDADILS
jgi:hypothetical protein